MKIIKESPAAIAEAIRILKSGGNVIHATETCYGIACDLANPDAVGKLFAVKRRPESQPVSALFSSLEMAKKYLTLSPRALTLAEKYLPGPLTIVLPQKPDSSPIFTTPSTHYSLHTTHSTGLRLSSHPFAQKLAEAFGGPIATTSANLHGKPNPYSVQDIFTQWNDMEPLPDLVIDSGPLPVSPPSTVIEVHGETVRVLRQGELIVA